MAHTAVVFPTKLSLPVDRPTSHKTLFLIKVLSFFFVEERSWEGSTLQSFTRTYIIYIYKIPHRVSHSVLCTCVSYPLNNTFYGIEEEKKIVIAAIQSATPSLLLPSANVVTSKDRGGTVWQYFSFGWVGRELSMPYYFGCVGQFCALHTRNAANAVKWPIEFVLMMQRRRVENAIGTGYT